MNDSRENSVISGAEPSRISMAPIGVFDSGFGGLTILRQLRKAMPDYDFIFLGDNARAPYGTRSFEMVYRFTLQAVNYLFGLGCQLVILACNTASAKALRSIQQRDLPHIDPQRRVLGVIRPTVEELPAVTRNGHIGLFATPGTVASRSYELEIEKLYPTMRCTSEPCPLWVPLIENGEYDTPGADYFVEKYISRLFAADPAIDTIILGCTHYPLLLPKIKRYVPEGVSIIDQGHIVAPSLIDYLRRHPEMNCRCSKGGTVEYLTTDVADRFDRSASLFMGENVSSRRVEI